MQSRMTYQADAEKHWPEDTLVKSVDLQKVIMLPHMPGLKAAIFTKRIVAFHETFASVGQRKNKKTPSLWSGMRAQLDEVQQRSPQPM